MVGLDGQVCWPRGSSVVSQPVGMLAATHPPPGNKLCLVVLIWHQIQKPEAGALNSGPSVALSDMGACELRVLS